MKTRRFSLVLLALVLLVAMALPAMAAEEGDSQAKLGHVSDTASLLTADQKSALLSRANELSEEYSISIYIIAVEDYGKYSDKSSVEEACADIFDKYDLGWGEDRDGVVFLVSRADRDYYFLFNGSWGNYAFTESGQTQLKDQVFPYLKDSDYYGAFNEYLNVCQEYLAAALEGSPVGGNESSSKAGFSILFFLPGLFAAGVTAVVLVAPMHSAGIKTQADDYIVPGSMRLTRQSDHFLRRTVSRTPRQKEQDHSGSSGHSGESVTRSGRGGKF